MDIGEGDSGVERSTRMPSLAVDPSVTPRLDDMLPGQSHSKLCIGDTIALCLQRDERLCFVGSEGFVELGSSLREFDLSRPVPWTHVDCLWVVEQKHQYDAQKALHKSKRAQTRASPSMHAVGANVTRHASETFASTRTTGRTNKFGGVGQVSEMVMAKHSKKAQEEQARQRREHAELLAAVKSERVSNDARNEEKRGVPLTYGETVQLRHLKSRKYLIVNPKRRSQSLGCYSVRLDAEGSEDAWLAIRPRHSFQFEGAPVYNHDLITMHSTKRQLWLHVGPSESVSGLVSGTTSQRSGRRPASSAGPAIEEADEVNASPTSTPFQLIIFKDHGGRPEPTAASGGVGDPGAGNAHVPSGVRGGTSGVGGNASSSRGGSSTNPDASSSTNRESGGDSAASDLIKCGDIIAFFHCDEQRHLVASWMPQSRQDDAHFADDTTSTRASPNALWQVQSPSGLGFPCVKQGEGYCLQHLASGRYLAVTTLEDTNFARGAERQRLERERLEQGEDAEGRQAEESAKEALASIFGAPRVRTDDPASATPVREAAGAMRADKLIKGMASGASLMTARAAQATEDAQKRGGTSMGKLFRRPGKDSGGASAPDAAPLASLAAAAAAPSAATVQAAAAGEPDRSNLSAASAGNTACGSSTQVVCLRPLGDGCPELFELHDAHSTSKHLRASSLIRLRHVRSGGWLSAVHAYHGEPKTGGLFKREQQSVAMGMIRADCYIRDGLLIERPLPVTRTFLAVAGVTQHLLDVRRELQAGRITGGEEKPFTNACISYLTNYFAAEQNETGRGEAPSGTRISVGYLQEVMRELGVLKALIALLTIPFERLGTVAFHKIGFDKPLLPQSKLAATLLFHCIENNAANCACIYSAIPSLEPAARKGIGIGQVLQEVFAVVPVESSQIDFWFDLLSKARRGMPSGGANLGPDFAGGSMILSLLHAFCFRRHQPVVANQNLIALKLITSPASWILEKVVVLQPGKLAELPAKVAEESPWAHMAASRKLKRHATAAVALPPTTGAAASAHRIAHHTSFAAETIAASNASNTASTPTSVAPTTSVAAGAAGASGAASDILTPDQQNSGSGSARDYAAMRESFSPLRKLDRSELQSSSDVAPEIDPGDLRDDLLDKPALLFKVERRPMDSGAWRSVGPTPPSVRDVDTPTECLCLSPCDPRRGQASAWTPLHLLGETPELFTHYLSELKLLGGLCSGNNGLTLHVLRTLYPFGLCMEMVEDVALPSQLRAAACVLTRQLFIEHSARLVRPMPYSVWDWDALLGGPRDSVIPPRGACLSLPPPAEEDGFGGWRSASLDSPQEPDQIERLQAFVSHFIVRDAVQCMQSKLDLELFGGVLDVCLHLLTYGHLQEVPTVEKLFEQLVAALGVPIERPPVLYEAGELDDHRLLLDAKALMCKLLEKILDFRLRLRLGSILRSLARASAIGEAEEASPTTADPAAESVAAKPADSLRRSPPGYRLSQAVRSLTKSEFGRAEHGWERLQEGSGEAVDDDGTPQGDDATRAAAPVPLSRAAMFGEGPVGADKAEDGGHGGVVTAKGTPKIASRISGIGQLTARLNAKRDQPAANMYQALRRGSKVLSWTRASEDLVRALVRTATEARAGAKANLVADALRVLFLQFNQSTRLSAAVSKVVLVKTPSAHSSKSPRSSPHGHGLRYQLSGLYGHGDDAMDGEEEGEPALSRDGSHADDASEEDDESEAAQARLIARTGRTLRRIIMGLKTIASTDPLPAAGAMLNNLAAAVEQLSALSVTRHQRRLQCSLSSHEAVVDAIRVLQQVEDGAAPSKQKQVVDGVYRLPPQELLAAREACFDFLATFCGGGTVASTNGTSASDLPFASTRGHDTFSARRNTFAAYIHPAIEDAERVDASAAEDSERDAANQEALFPHFELILDHMSRVRKATTAAIRLLEANTKNCASVTDAHLDAIFSLMLEGSARYSWYVDVLLCLARGQPDVDSALPLKIMRRLLGAPNGYLLVLYSGTAGRERRARELASLSQAAQLSDTGMVAFHHGLVQLLAELCSGLANEVEMHVQSVLPLHEVCAHICDAFCPYAIRASFFVVLMEGYTVTALKVQSLVQSPAVWQVLAIFVSELRSLLESIAGHGDDEDRAQALLAIRPSTRGPSFIQSGLWFCVAFLQKHLDGQTLPWTLQDDHRACLTNLQRVCTRILHLERARVRAWKGNGNSTGTTTAAGTETGTGPGPGALAPVSTASAGGLARILGASLPSATEEENLLLDLKDASQQAVDADEHAPHARSQLMLSPHQLTLISAVLQALKEKGVGAGASAWRNMGLSAGLQSVTKSLRGQLGQKPVISSPSGGSAHAARRKAALEAASHNDRDLRYKPSASGDTGVDDAGVGADCVNSGEGTNGTDNIDSRVAGDGADFHNTMEEVHVDANDNGLSMTDKVIAAVRAAGQRLQVWEADEFARSVLIFKESHETILPIIDQLMAAPSAAKGAGAASAMEDDETAAFQERCLRVLKALLKGDTTMQDKLNEMGVTRVMVRMLASPSTPRNFEAALELGTALADGGNVRVQRTIYAELAASGSNDTLASIAHALNSQCNKLQMHFLEQKQHAWYEALLAPHLQEANRARPLRREEAALLGKLSRGSSATISNAVARALAIAAGTSEKNPAPSIDPEVNGAAGYGNGNSNGSTPTEQPAKLPSSINVELANKCLLFLECCCEGHFAEMQSFLRTQENMRTQVNVVIDLVNNLLVLERSLSSLTISLTCQLYQTLIELVQGPCAANQRFLIGTNLCDVAVRFMHGTYSDCDTADVIELKILCLKLLLSMVEGVQEDTIPRRIASSLDASKLIAELDHAYEQSGCTVELERLKSGADNTDLTELQASFRELGFHFFLLVRTLAKHAPAALNLCRRHAKSYAFYAKNTGAIEIVRFDKTLEEVYFPIPDLCNWLSERSRQKLEWEVDRSTPQKRIEDFVKRSEGMIHEMRHNERISHIPLFRLLHYMHDTIHGAMFVLSWVTNALILLFTYPETDCVGEDVLVVSTECREGYWHVRFDPPMMGVLVTFLGLCLIFACSASLLEHCVVMLPLTLRASWERRGVRIDFPEIWPLKMEYEYIDTEATRGGGDEADTGSVAAGAEAGEGRGEDGEDKALSDSDKAKVQSGKMTEEDDEERLMREAREAEVEKQALWRHIIVMTPLLLLQQDRVLVYFLLYLGICALGLLYSPFFFIVTLFDIVVRSRLLQKVIEAVTVNSESLSLTFVLVAVVVYHFTLFGQLFFRTDFIFQFHDAYGDLHSVDLCSSTKDCLMTTFYLGLSYEGLAQGLSDMREQWYTDPDKAKVRWAIDLLFYIAVIVMLLNIIFGIVIDTFAQQRDLQNQIKDNMENACFVCGIDRNSFDRKHPIGFAHHIEHEHNIWNYLYFMIHLRTKRQTEYTGPESYVAEMLANNDLSFFPILKTSSIVFEDQISNEALLVRVDAVSQQVDANSERLEGIIEGSLERMHAVLGERP